MKSYLRPLRVVLGALATILAVAATSAATTPRHFDLAKSVPADSATVSEVSKVTLWFTDAPSEGSVSIRLIDPAGEAVDDVTVLRDEDDDKVFHMATPDHLAPGAYTVSWRGIGRDGHVVRGQFGFTLASR